MTQSSQRWTKPELKRLGKLTDVAGNATFNADGASKNPKS